MLKKNVQVYPSDISDKEWVILGPFVAQGKIGRPRKHDIRHIINAIRYVMKSGCQWRLLPKDFPSWQTVYDYYLPSHWSKIQINIFRSSSTRGRYRL